MIDRYRKQFMCGISDGGDNMWTQRHLTSCCRAKLSGMPVSTTLYNRHTLWLRQRERLLVMTKLYLSAADKILVVFTSGSNALLHFSIRMHVSEDDVLRGTVFAEMFVKIDRKES